MEADLTLEVAREQLARMRGMNALYHKRFFADVRFVMVMIVGLLAAGYWEIPQLLLVVPFVALWGAVQTAFDASYLIFARHYAASLEAWINRRLGSSVLVGAELEASYLFPLAGRKMVTVPFSGPLTWFNLVTIFTTIGGVIAAVVGVWSGWDTLSGLSMAARLGYWTALIGLTALALGVGWWWFAGGVGERRLAVVLSRLDEPR